MLLWLVTKIIIPGCWKKVEKNPGLLIIILKLECSCLSRKKELDAVHGH